MSERTMVDLVEEWQSGAFLLAASALTGIGVGTFTRQYGPTFAVGGFLAGVVLAFVLLSYLLYGR